MFGAVTADNEAVLTVTVAGLSVRREAHVEVVVDAGFTGHLTLRPETVESLALPVVGSAESVLDDGSTTIEDLCLVQVETSAVMSAIHEPTDVVEPTGSTSNAMRRNRGASKTTFPSARSNR